MKRLAGVFLMIALLCAFSRPQSKVRPMPPLVRLSAGEAKLVTCYIEKREIVRPREHDNDFQVTRMHMDCIDGPKLEVLGIEY